MQQWLLWILRFLIDNSNDDEFRDIEMHTGMKDNIFKILLKSSSTKEYITIVLENDGKNIISRFDY